MCVRSVLLRMVSLVTLAVVSGAADAPVSRAAHCPRGEPETVSMADVRLPSADGSDRIVQQALDLVQPFIHVRPRAGAIRASDYPDLPLAGLAGFRACMVGSGVIDPEIYINTETNMYRLAAGDSVAGLVAVAATVVHEFEHGKPAGEAAAYDAEAGFVRHWLGTETAAGADRQLLARFLSALEEKTRALHPRS